MLKTSRIKGFHLLSPKERLDKILKISKQHINTKLFEGGGLNTALADLFSENVIGIFSHPLSLAPNFIVNGREVFVPMVTEEPSVVAAASKGALLARNKTGFNVKVDSFEISAQILLQSSQKLMLSSNKLSKIKEILEKHTKHLKKYNGGNVRVDFYNVSEELSVIHFYVNTAEAMGANIVNTVGESSANEIEQLTKAKVITSIVSNSSLNNIVICKTQIPFEILAQNKREGSILAQNISLISKWANLDPLRAVTNNKGIMNGVEAVVIASGNDTRAVSASVHFFASFSGKYIPLSRWEADEKNEMLKGYLEIPLSIGFVGGTTSKHPLVAELFSICNINSRKELTEITAAVGLANNLSALLALADEGIQAGHMKLHNRKKL